MHIWVPRTKIIENTKEPLAIPINTAQGFYKIEGMLPDGRKRVIADWFPNIVTDIGLDRWGTGKPITTCSVGSGSATPAASDTRLQTWVADSTVVSAVVYGKKTISPYYGYAQTTFSFAAPGANKTIHEVGAGWGPGGTNLFSRARVKGPSGLDSSIGWLAAEVLYVSYEARIYPWEDTVAIPAVVIGGVTYTGVSKLYGASNPAVGQFWNNAMQLAAPGASSGPVAMKAHSGTLSAITGTGPGGTAVPPTSSAQWGYDGWKGLAGQCIWGPHDGNMGINSFSFTPSAHPHQMSIVPTLTKQAGYTLAISFIPLNWNRQT